MSAPRPTTLVHPVTGVGSFFAFGGRREVGVVLGRKVALPIGGGQEYRSVSAVHSTGDSGGRVWSFDFRACEVFGATYWGICRWNSSCARTPFLVRRAASTVRRIAWIVAVSPARCSGAITRHAIKGSRCSLGVARCTPAIARRTVGAKIRTVQPARRTRRVIRWSFSPERVQELGKRRIRHEESSPRVPSRHFITREATRIKKCRFAGVVKPRRDSRATFFSQRLSNI